MEKSDDELSSMLTDILKGVERVNAKIDSMKRLYNIDLTKECSELVQILSELTDIHLRFHGRELSRVLKGALESKLDRVYLLEFQACNKVLEKLIRQLSDYAGELEQSLINTGEMRRAINEAKRLQAKAGVDLRTSRTSETIKNSSAILDQEIERLSAARSEMKAKEPEEKRKVAFRLVELFVGFLIGIIVPYFTYTAVYLKSDPFESGKIGMLAIIYLIGCICIYVAIGAIAKVGRRE